MPWLHAGWQVAALLVGLLAGWGGLARYVGRARGRPARPGAFRRRRHQVLGWVFAGMLAVGYGLGLLAVHRAGRDVLTGPHALVGTIVLMFAAIVALLGTALAGREDDRLARLHRLFGCAAIVLIAVQMVLGVSLLTGPPPG